MNCGDIGPLISAYYDGDATPEERQLVEDCLQSSPEAAAMLREYRRISNEFETLPQPTPPADLRRNVLNEVHRLSGAHDVRELRAATRASTLSQRTNTGSVRQPVTPISLFSQALKVAGLLAVALLLAVSLNFAYNQFLKPAPLGGIGTATPTIVTQAVVLTPTPLPSDTPNPLMTATPMLLNGDATVTPAPPPNPPSVVVAQGATNTPAPTDTPRPVAPTHTPVPPTGTPAPPTDTPPPPTATAPPPSSTPTPSSTPSPTLTLSPTATPACPLTPVRGFGKLYREHGEVSASLGCAMDTEMPITGTLLNYQHGQMIWDSTHRLIYVFHDQLNGKQQYEIYPETWEQGQSEPTPIATPPNDTLHIPVRGFGKVWNEHQLGATLGYATDAYEIPLNEVVENFQHGRMLWIDLHKKIYVMVGSGGGDNQNSNLNKGTWQVYDDTFTDTAPLDLSTPTPALTAPAPLRPTDKQAGQQ